MFLFLYCWGEYKNDGFLKVYIYDNREKLRVKREKFEEMVEDQALVFWKEVKQEWKEEAYQEFVVRVGEGVIDSLEEMVENQTLVSWKESEARVERRGVWKSL